MNEPAAAAIPVTIDFRRLTVAELAYLHRAVVAEVKRRHAEREKGTSGGEAGTCSSRPAPG